MDPRVTKLRILWERAKRDAEAVEEAHKKAFDEIVYPARRRADEASEAYWRGAEALGWCVVCDPPCRLENCPGHVWQAVSR